MLNTDSYLFRGLRRAVPAIAAAAPIHVNRRGKTSCAYEGRNQNLPAVVLEARRNWDQSHHGYMGHGSSTSRTG